jgi:hypothetical protein
MKIVKKERKKERKTKYWVFERASRLYRESPK